MSRITKFAGRDPGPTARMAGFLAHLRENGLRLGAEETRTALDALTYVNAADPNRARAALKAVCTGSKDEALRFDDLFNSYWMDMGRVRQKVVPKAVPKSQQENVHSSRDAAG